MRIRAAIKPEQPETSQTAEGVWYQRKRKSWGKEDEQGDAYAAQTDSENIHGIKIKLKMS